MSRRAIVMGAGLWGASMARAVASGGYSVDLMVAWSARGRNAARGIGALKGALSGCLGGDLAAMERAAAETGAPLRYGRHLRDPWLKARVLDPGADLLAVAGWPNLIPQDVLEAFPRGGVNAHPSLLPRHKGPHPLEEALKAGEKEVGVTVQG